MDKFTCRPNTRRKSIVKLAKEQGLKQQEPEQAEFISFSASTRISGVNLPNGEQIRKGALDAILKFVDEDYSQDLELKARVEQVAKRSNSFRSSLINIMYWA